jgi:hypothetical protein
VAANWIAGNKEDSRAAGRCPDKPSLIGPPDIGPAYTAPPPTAERQR